MRLAHYACLRRGVCYRQVASLAAAPVDHLCLVNHKALGIDGIETRSLTRSTIYVLNLAAVSAYEVVVIVTAAGLIPRHQTLRLDASQQSDASQRIERVIDRLM